ncbi:Homogentisate phytyltransferase [Aquicella siphonis]|uniref:Homogentisate phytyltransferase n=1 Tax=Aquicella siphonis TaxID=254247 RepID=A0A5E4PJX2_9COXI|nr:UbiA family prenyltransferase [Aquicella siphonis]VVC76865.1 Homogentisate phytyltransferase [Aquicella siphonis]
MMGVNSIQKIRTVFSNGIHYLENSNIPGVNFFLSGLFAVILRNFLESFSQRSGNYFDLSAVRFAWVFSHFTLSYLALALVYILILYYATKTKIEKIMRVVFPGMIVLIVAPLVDLITSGGRGHDILYFLPAQPVDLLKNFFTYCSDYPGITLGIRVEVLIILTGCFLYFLAKGKSIVLSLAYTLLAYSCNFIMACSPIIIYQFLTVSGFSYQYSTSYMINFYSLLILVLSIWIAWLADKTLFTVFIRDSRFFRVLHYQLMLWFGFLLGLLSADQSAAAAWRTHGAMLLDMIFSMAAICFAAIFTIVFNNISDREIDRINCPERPLINDTVNLKVYEKIGYGALFAAIYFSALAGVKALFVILLVSGLYYLYSMPPLRVKRVFLLSKLVISGSSLALVILGYVIAADTLRQFPALLYPIFLIGVTLSANIIDLKDVKGDSAFYIKTLPVVVGETKARMIIGLSFLLTYLALCLAFHSAFFTFALAAAGCMQFYLINQKHCQEWKPILLHLGSMFIVLSYCLWKLAV